jgi:NAD+ synthase (glutamine-hydrolysing)
VGKQLLRERMLSHMARKYGLPVVIVGQVGGNDDLIFDGHSALSTPRAACSRAPAAFPKT